MKTITLFSSALVLGLALSFAGCGSSSEVKAPAEKVKAPAEKAKAPANMVPIEKQGFLTIDSCAAQGAFQDCYLENYICGTDGCYKNTEPGVLKDVNVVLFSHKDGITYKLDISKIPVSDIDGGINRNDVTIIGEYDSATQTIYATEFKAPPPPKKSFFKGCL